jgi:5-hydroxyisourate hydrolase-like protein (transthyretin family)
MTRAALIVVLAVTSGGLLSSQASQLQSAASQPARSEPGVIRGHVSSAENGRPLRRATVSLRSESAQTARPLLTVSTNTQGQFEMREVPAGSYFVSASRTGYLELQHGQRRPRERGVAVEVRSAAVRDRVDIVLPRGSVITGRVVDELGAPYPGVIVTLLEMRYQLGARIYLPVTVGTTDDLGRFRLSGLLPGRYYLLANSSETWRNEKTETFGYAATFFPAAQALEHAAPVTVGIAEEQALNDLLLVAGRTARIRGRVQRPAGEPVGGEAVGLSRSVGGGAVLFGGLNTRTGPDGTFEFRDVPPATYELRASGGASMLLPVNGADIDNILLVPRVGSTMRASFVTETGERPPFPASGVRVLNIAPPGARVLPRVAVPGVDNDWTITMTGMGGPFVFRMVNLPESWMLDSVRLGDKDITDAPYEVPTGGLEIGDMQFVLTQRAGTVTGSVVTADGKPTADATVVLFAEDASQWTVASRFVRSTRPTADGAFKITGLPGATYLAIAREYVMDGEWEAKEFLEAARQDAVRVTLPRGGNESVALKVH